MTAGCVCVCVHSSAFKEIREHLRHLNCSSQQTAATSCETMHQYGDDTVDIMAAAVSPTEPPASFLPDGQNTAVQVSEWTDM